MPLNEILNGRWHISQLEIAAPAQLAGHILRNVLGPALGRIEGDDADRIAVLARKEILNNGFQVRGFVVGFPPGAADLPEIIRNEIDRLIAVSRVRSRASNWFYAYANSATTGIQADQRSLVRIGGGVESSGVCWSRRRNRQACSGSIPQGCSAEVSLPATCCVSSSAASREQCCAISSLDAHEIEARRFTLARTQRRI